MRRSSLWAWLFSLLLLWPLGCGGNRSAPEGTPVVRVRLLENQQQVMLAASEAPTITTGSDPVPRRMNVPSGTNLAVALAPGGWRVGDLTLGTGVLTVKPASDGSVSINGQSYRGNYRLVPVAAGKFDVVNDVDIDSYLKSVVSKELLWNWHDEAYKAQAIVARTYALYEVKAAGTGRHWDLHPDQRSQVYGGVAAESRKSRKAVEATEGIVVAYGQPGQERIFKCYFSSCCGGITQSAADAFGDAYIEPLSDQDVDALCNASPRFNWGPVIIRKDELTRRIRIWGTKKNRAEKDMAAITRIDIQAANRWGRPTRFVITDAQGRRYSLGGEEIRWAVNTDAENDSYKITNPNTLYSSFFKIINAPDAIHFVDGHGWGHGVGMCQWCAQRRASEGLRHEDIVLAAYQRARLVRAY